MKGRRMGKDGEGWERKGESNTFIKAQTQEGADSSQEVGTPQLPLVCPALGSVNDEARPPRLSCASGAALDTSHLQA